MWRNDGKAEIATKRINKTKRDSEKLKSNRTIRNKNMTLNYTEYRFIHQSSPMLIWVDCFDQYTHRKFRKHVHKSCIMLLQRLNMLTVELEPGLHNNACKERELGLWTDALALLGISARLHFFERSSQKLDYRLFKVLP